MSATLPAADLAGLLADWLPQQRWFGARGRPVGSVEVVAVTSLPTDGEPQLDHVVVAVAFDDGGPTRHHQVLVARRSAPREDLEHALIGALGDQVAYDGLFDTDVTAWLLAALREGLTVGDLRFVPEPGAVLPAGVTGRVLGVEQSNTSVGYGEHSILKLFRLVAPGVNPDLELHRALRGIDSGEVAALQGAIEGTLDGEAATLAMLQDYAANSAEGWAMALASVRDLLAEGDLRADEVGGDFAGEAHRLGRTVAVLHDDLARALGSTDDDPAAVAARMSIRLDAAVADVPELNPYAAGVRAAFDRLAALGSPVVTQRVHGDLHLGQTLRTPTGWLVIDFEGEPSAPLAARRASDSPLRDVAGMLRSFDYAANHQLLESTDAGPDAQRTWRAAEWAERNRAAFCDGYASRAAADPRDQLTVLRAYELDKAVYEAVYETRNRPAWAPIPLGSIARLLGEPHHSESAT